MSKKTPEQAIAALARKHGETPAQVRAAMQQAIDAAFSVPEDHPARQEQMKIPCKGARPTPEELIEYMANRLAAP